MIDRFEHFICATSEISKCWRKLAGEEMEKHGLKAPHAIYFTVLAKHQASGLTASQICELCCRDKADVSRMMSIMEDKGLLFKEGGHHKLYNGVFKLTGKGLDVAQCVKSQASKAVAAAGRDLSPETREIFYMALDSIVKNLRELSTKGIPD